MIIGLLLGFALVALYIAFPPTYPIVFGAEPENRVLIVGDSYAVYFPYYPDADRVAYGGASIRYLKKKVSASSDDIQYDLVIICALLPANGRPLEQDRKGLLSLASVCREKFRPQRMIVYDPAVMWELLETPEYQIDTNGHLTPLGYAQLIERNQLL